MAKKISFKSYDLFLLISFVLCAIDFAIVFLLLPHLQPVVPLFYTFATGAEQLVSQEYLYILPSVATLISISNFVFLSVSRKYDEFLLKLFAICTLVFQILILCVLLRIIWLVM